MLDIGWGSKTDLASMQQVNFDRALVKVHRKIAALRFLIMDAKVSEKQRKELIKNTLGIIDSHFKTKPQT